MYKVEKQTKIKKEKFKNQDKSSNILNKKRKETNLIIEDFFSKQDKNLDKKRDIQKKGFDINLNLDPTKIEFLKILNDDKWEKHSGYENTFIAFKSMYDILVLIYTNSECSIISYDIKDNKRINEIKSAHKYNITQFQHYFDEINQRDLILSLSAWIYNVKIWNIENWECLYNFEDEGLAKTSKLFKDFDISISNDHYTYSANLFKDNNQINIIIGRFNIYYDEDPDPIISYDLKGNKIKEINDSKDIINFTDVYYDTKLSKNFIIAINEDYIISFDYNENKIYNKYKIEENFNDSNEYDYQKLNILINNKKSNVELINIDNYNKIKIWDFHSGKLLKLIIVKEALFSMCIWNNKYLFLGCENNMKLLDLKNEKIIKAFNGHNDKIKTIIKLVHPKYGECLLTQGQYQESIKLWGEKSKL